jgi:hypothetical protein
VTGGRKYKGLSALGVAPVSVGCRVLDINYRKRSAEGFQRHLKAIAFRRILAVMETHRQGAIVGIDEVSSRRGFARVGEILGRSNTHEAEHGVRRSR